MAQVPGTRHCGGSFNIGLERNQKISLRLNGVYFRKKCFASENIISKRVGYY